MTLVEARRNEGRTRICLTDWTMETDVCSKTNCWCAFVVQGFGHRLGGALRRLSDFLAKSAARVIILPLLNLINSDQI